MSFAIAEATLWRLVQLHTGRVGYQRGVKAEGLSIKPPVIDCSGWVALLLTEAMRAANEAATQPVFGDEYRQALQSWSDRIIDEIELRTRFILDMRELATHAIPRYATLGLKLGNPAWANNHPRTRGITHIAQIVRRPIDGTPFVSESFGYLSNPGITLTALDNWLVRATELDGFEGMWAVDPFREA